MKKVVILLLVIFGCEKLKPESVSVPEYPDLEKVFNQQIPLLIDKKLNKVVWLDGESETKLFSLDADGWKKELSFLKEINPNTPEYVGAFEKTEEGNSSQLMLMPDEKGELKMFSYIMNDTSYSQIRATIHEDKEVYSHHRDFEMTFENGLLKEYVISGYQKIVLKDTIRFQIEGAVGN